MRTLLPLAILGTVLAGSAAALLLRSREDGPAPYRYEAREAVHATFDGVRAFAHAEKLVAFGPRPSGSEALEASRRYLEDELRKSGWTSRRQSFEADTPAGRIAFVNLIARHASEGGDPWENPVELIIASHYETKLYTEFPFVGANDGASSSGALLEIAAVTAAAPDLARRLELVFFDGEEAFGPSITPTDGLYGSRFYALQWRRQPAPSRPRAGIVLDMIGDRDLNVGLPSDSPRNLARQLLAAADELGWGDFFGMAAHPIIDDHVPLNLIGIPAIDIIDLDYQPWWHTEGDTLERISPDSLAVVGRTTLLFVEKYLLPSLD